MRGGNKQFDLEKKLDNIFRDPEKMTDFLLSKKNENSKLWYGDDTKDHPSGTSSQKSIFMVILKWNITKRLDKWLYIHPCLKLFL